MATENNIQRATFALRVGITIVFMAWTIDKIVNYAHNSGMIGHYYGWYSG